MTATAYSRGHEIKYTDCWVYVDNGKPLDSTRPCKRCGKYPTPEGHDACLGILSGVTSACCGHGVEDRYVIKHKEGD